MVCNGKSSGAVCSRNPGLNPYSTGIWSATSSPFTDGRLFVVLILILLEYGLQPEEIAAVEHAVVVS